MGFRGVLLVSAGQEDSGKSTLGKPLASYLDAEYITIIDTESKRPNGEFRRFDKSEVKLFISYLESKAKNGESFVAEIGGEVFDDVGQDFSLMEWPDFISLVCFIFDINNKDDVVMKGIERLFGFGLHKDRLTVILNQATQEKLDLPAVKNIVGFCEEYKDIEGRPDPIDFCPAVIPECKAFRIQDGNNQSIWELGKENTYNNAYATMSAAIDVKKPDSEINSLSQEAVAYYYIDLINKIVLPPLFDHVDRMVTIHGE